MIIRVGCREVGRPVLGHLEDSVKVCGQFPSQSVGRSNSHEISHMPRSAREPPFLPPHIFARQKLETATHRQQFSSHHPLVTPGLRPSSLALNGGGRIFHSPSSPLFSLLALVSSHLLRDSLCTALQTERLWIWSTGLSTQLTPSSRREAWVRGNLSALTERSQLATRWTRGRDGESCV